MPRIVSVRRAACSPNGIRRLLTYRGSRLAARWGFAKAGTLGWWWKVTDGSGTRRSASNFPTFEACIEDATEHGYVLERPGAAPGAAASGQPRAPARSPETRFAGSAPATGADGIAIYTDSGGDIVIRQCCADRPFESVVTISPEYAGTMIEALQRQLGTVRLGCPTVAACETRCFERNLTRAHELNHT